MHHCLQLGPALPFCTLVGIKAPKLNAEQFIVFQNCCSATFAGGEEGKKREEATHLAHHGCLAAGQILHACSKY
jgi:hypothetical protein